MRDVERVHQELISIAVQRDRLQTRQAHLLVLAEQLEIWRQFNCAHIYDYLEHYRDLHPRTARTRDECASERDGFGKRRDRRGEQDARDGPVE